MGSGDFLTDWKQMKEDHIPSNWPYVGNDDVCNDFKTCSVEAWKFSK